MTNRVFSQILKIISSSFFAVACFSFGVHVFCKARSGRKSVNGGGKRGPCLSAT